MIYAEDRSQILQMAGNIAGGFMADSRISNVTYEQVAEASLGIAIAIFKQAAKRIDEENSRG